MLTRRIAQVGGALGGIRLNRIVEPTRRFGAAAVFGLLLTLGAPLAHAAKVSVDIEGLEQRQLRDNVRGVLRIARVSRDSDTRPRTIRRLHRRAERDIREALQPFGYYQPTIVSELREEGDNAYRAVYRIELGPPTLIRNIDIKVEGSGAEETAVRNAVAESSLSENSRLLHAEYSATRNRIKEAALSRGYLDAEYARRELRVNPDENFADVVLHFETGEVYRFGEITIEQEILEPEFVQRYVRINPGQRFDPQKLIDLQLTLSDLGYFASVQVDTQRDETEDNHIPVIVYTQPIKPQRYEVGAGFGTDTGARTRLLADIRRLNRRGHTMSFDARVSELANDLTVSYTIPVGNTPGESFSFLAQYEDENLEDGERQTFRLGVARNWTLGDWLRNVYLNVIQESFDIGGESQDTVLLTPGASISRTEVDDPVFARSGWSGFADVHGAVEDVLADTSFLQTRLTLRGVLPGFGPNARILLRTDWGANFVEDFNRLPASERFYAGGDESVRGYRYESLSPRDEEGRAIGGEYLLTGTVEYEQIIWNGLGLAGFVDAGNTSIGETPRPVFGAGIGVRYRSPVGVIRLDLAHPFDDTITDDPVRVHFGIRAGL